MIVRTQKPIYIWNPYCILVDTEDLKNAIRWYSRIFVGKPVVQRKNIFMYGKYPAISIYGEKIHVHRILMMYWIGRKLFRDEYSHHINGDSKDCRKQNLTLMRSNKHQSLHNKGKKLSEEHKKKIGIANRKRKGMKIKKRVDVDLDRLRLFLKDGWSINKIANHFNCDWSTVKSRIYENPELLENV